MRKAKYWTPCSTFHNPSPLSQLPSELISTYAYHSLIYLETCEGEKRKKSIVVQVLLRQSTGVEPIIWYFPSPSIWSDRLPFHPKCHAVVTYKPSGSQRTNLQFMMRHQCYPKYATSWIWQIRKGKWFWRVRREVRLTPWMNQKPHVVDKQPSEHHVCKIKFETSSNIYKWASTLKLWYKVVMMIKQKCKPWNSLQKENISIISNHTKSFIWVSTKERVACWE